MLDNTNTAQAASDTNENTSGRDRTVEAEARAVAEQVNAPTNGQADATTKPRRRRTNEEISLSGLIQNKKRRLEKRADLCQQIENKLSELSRFASHHLCIYTVQI